MDSPLWVQVASLVIVLLALAVSTYQVFLARRQTFALQLATEKAMTAGHAETRDIVLYRDEQLMAWHLRNRKCEGNSSFENKQRYFIIKKLESDEVLYLGSRQGYITGQTWEIWAPVVKADILISKTREIWPQVRWLFSSDFTKFVEETLSESE